ncbi:MAG: leucyl/phenylalanyl-tRNA--protein transferase [Tenacibaculum sp.]
MIYLGKEIIFPRYEAISEQGIIALGGDLSVERLIYAYKLGIFPWYNSGDPIIWHCPNWRMVLFPEELKISNSMKQLLRTSSFVITQNKAFAEVIFYCSSIKRPKQKGTWLNSDMQQAYIELYKKGYAKSIEVWKDGKIVGGLYGVDLGNGIFYGESMFSKKSNTSKLALIYLVKNFGYKLIDCQVYNQHLASLGAREIPREIFLKFL